MPERIREVMTADPVSVARDASIVEAARIMRDRDIGDVVVRDGNGGDIVGILTDRDIVVRAIAERPDAQSVKVGDVCSSDLVTVAPDDAVAEVVQKMREADIRRVPVMEHGELVGIVSIGDLAVDRDPDSALADISAAPPNN